MNRFPYLIAAIMATVGCAADMNSLLPGSLAERKSTLSIYAIKYSIPVGTSVEAAQSLLTAEGFTCRVQKNSTLKFEELRASGEVVKGTIENVDYLDCTRTRQSGLVTCVDIVDVVFTSDGVTDVKVFNEFIGP